MQAKFNAIRAFDFANSNVLLWIYKKSSAVTKYRACHVPIDDSLKASLVHFIRDEMNRISEFAPYSYIAQNNESSCLFLDENETDFICLKNLVDRPEPENLTRGVDDLKGADGYVVKYSLGPDVVYAIKRSTASWKTKYSNKFINMIFSNGELSAIESNAFSIEKNFDFYYFNSTIFISNKRGFESVLRHKSSYVDAFINLQAAPEFSALFTNMQPLIDYVGSNSIHLRRMAVIEQKGLYSRPNFTIKFQNVSIQRNWGINFDPATGKIVPCDQTVQAIMQVLLDHRLVSEITDNTYDVPDAVQI